LKDAFLFYKNKFTKIFPWIFVSSVTVVVARLILLPEVARTRFFGDWWESFIGGLFFGMSTPDLFFIGINALANTVVLYVVYKNIASDAVKVKINFSLPAFLGVFLVTLVVYGLLYALGGWGVFFLLFTYVSFLLIAFSPVASGQNFFQATGRSWQLIGSNYPQLFILHVVLLLITFSFLMILSAPLIYMYLNIFTWNFAKTDTWINDVLYFIELLIKVLSFYMTLPVIAACAAYLYYSCAEIMEASNLYESIENFGKARSKYRR
jgi:hypothetical protein